MKGRNQTEPAAHKTELTTDLNSTTCSQQVKKLVPFEQNLNKISKNLRFQEVDNNDTIIKQNFYCSRQKRQICIALVKKSTQTFYKMLSHQNIRT